MSVRSTIAPLAMACGILFSAVGCLAVFKDVDLTFARVAEPITEVLPAADGATVVLAYPMAPHDGGKQAVTYVLEDGTVVGEVTAHSFAVSRVPAGRHTLVGGIPELHNFAGCFARTEDFQAGRVYVLSTGAIVPVTPALERTLSKLSYLELDLPAGRRRVQAEQASFWATCVKIALADEASNRRIVAAVNVAFHVPPPPTGDLGVTRLSIPAPP